ncbi:GAF domain-containing protein [Bacterioplanoides sp. SCSIO 12839]|uniref:GAF domain-containing protein n=1 Tax=Bacterioplanoides sp. SCSIO 12839 TaxID=2829569 RepID=UPI002103F2EA|nr:GAF domain-containing protein [Bacterioplanoides sp. SCSIO 12839]UTW48527.1 GAF domain-containing protein [Bacterioplanoides sp. SCSIO 12839]
MSETHLLSDPYRALGTDMPFNQRLEHLYRVLREQLEGVDRFALARYNPDDQSLSAFMFESEAGTPFVDYCQPLDKVPSLQQLAEQNTIRVVDDMREFRQEEFISAHSEALLAVGLRASFTMPLRHQGELLGFLFLNSKRAGYFAPQMLAYCNVWGHLVGQYVAQELLTAPDGSVAG